VEIFLEDTKNVTIYDIALASIWYVQGNTALEGETCFDHETPSFVSDYTFTHTANFEAEYDPEVVANKVQNLTESIKQSIDIEAMDPATSAKGVARMVETRVACAA
jgi:hypothetical protein